MYTDGTMIDGELKKAQLLHQSSPVAKQNREIANTQRP